MPQYKLYAKDLNKRELSEFRHAAERAMQGKPESTVEFIFDTRLKVYRSDVNDKGEYFFVEVAEELPEMIIRADLSWQK